MTEEESLGPTTRAFLARARAGEGLSSGDKSRLRRRVLSGLAASAAAASAAPAGAGTVLGASAALKIVVATALLGAGGGFLFRTLRVDRGLVTRPPVDVAERPAAAPPRSGAAVAEARAPRGELGAPPPSVLPRGPHVAASRPESLAPRRLTPSASRPVARLGPTPGQIDRRAPASEAPTPRRLAPLAAAPRPQTRPVSVVSEPPAPRRLAPPEALHEETRLLSAARALLNEREAGRALSALESLAERFPKGALAQERQVVRVSALLALGRQDEACAEARRFAQAWPRSPHAARVRAACPRAR